MTIRRALAAVVGAAVFAAPAPALAAVDLSSYVRTARHELPPLTAETSAVTYNWDTDSLFIVDDEATSIVQLSKTGALINTMPLAAGAFDDTEGLTYVGNGQFVLAEERVRTLDRFTYTANTTLTRAQVQSVKLGTTIGNEGFEGVTHDPLSNGFVIVKETNPQGVFQTTVDWAAGTASNGSPTAVNSTDLFDPTGLSLLDIADVFAQDDGQLLVLSQESGKLVNATRAGTVTSSLAVGTAGEGHEGVTMDRSGRIYVVNEVGGGDRPQLWVYAPSGQGGTNQAPTAVTLTNPIASVSSTATRVKVADIVVTDDALGTNALSLVGVDAAAFEIDSSALYLKAGTPLDRPSFSVAVAVDDTTVGATPDATSTTLTLPVASVAVTEASPWSSGNSPYGADWFEVTNRGTTPVDLTGWKVDDSSNAFATALVLNGVGVVAPGESVLFVEGTAAKAGELRAAWNLPASVQIGFYSGSGIGLSTDGDAVNLFTPAGTRITGVSFGASTSGFTFENVNGLKLSSAGVNGAWTQGGETGSPGTSAPKLAVTEASPWSSGDSPYGADWFEVTNLGAHAVDLAGWKVDDSSNAFASAVALTGVTSIAAGESVLFIEGASAKADQLRAAWGLAPTVQIGSYSGSGIGLSTGGDSVYIFDTAGARSAGFDFGSATTGFTFEAVNGVRLSVANVNGAFVRNGETGSPGRIAAPYAEVKTPATIVANVPPQLSLTLGLPAVFAPFTAGIAREYTAATTLTVTSTAGDAALSLSDPGHLTNGSYQLARPLQVALSKTAWTGPVSNDVVDVALEQAVGANDPLRTGSYSKTITFTLSTTSP